jgi:hypothetical protein
LSKGIQSRATRQRHAELVRGGGEALRCHDLREHAHPVQLGLSLITFLQQWIAANTIYSYSAIH